MPSLHLFSVPLARSSLGGQPWVGPTGTPVPNLFPVGPWVPHSQCEPKELSWMKPSLSRLLTHPTPSMGRGGSLLGALCLSLNAWYLGVSTHIREISMVCVRVCALVHGCLFLMCARTPAAGVSFSLFPEHLAQRMESPCTSTPLSPVTSHSTLTTTECVSEGERDSGRNPGLMLAR